MAKEGVLGQLEIINVAWHPEKAKELGVTSAPWTKIGIFELSGRYSEEELRNWAQLAESESGTGKYFIHLIENREMHKLIKTIRQIPSTLDDLLDLLADIDMPMNIRIGIGAAIEELQEHNLLLPAIPKLTKLTLSKQPQIRADACHYLGLTGSPDALSVVQSLLLDEDEEVKEIAAETLALLENNS
jgi:HEAT repeat protein